MKALLQRLTQHPKTTIAGVGLGAVFYYVLDSWHCQMPSGATGWFAWVVVAGPVVLGMIAKDK